MLDGLYIRTPSNDHDWSRFEALNFSTFFASMPPYEKLTEKQFRKQHKELLARYSPRFHSDRGAVLIAANDQHDYLGHNWLGAQTDFFTGANLPWVFDLTVMPEFRGQGVGRFLMDDCVFRVRTLGFKMIGLQVMAHNIDAERFYQRYGFFPKAHSMVMKLGGS
ncbi:MAG: GNAT family N-acetyltransferase [Planctomycetes bacterium]|nr:GNAT family N-acetyltransferase [Planctomycetota bacterium]